MERVHVFSIDKLICNSGDIYSHIFHETDSDESIKPPETLGEHMELTRKYLYKLFKEKGISKLLDGIISKITLDGKILGKECRLLLKELFINAIVLHDMGKLNPAFQKKVMLNAAFDGVIFGNKEHSLLSAMIYIDIFYKKISDFEDYEERRFLRNILYCFAYSISRHHTYLKDINKFLTELDAAQKLFAGVREHIYYKSEALFTREFIKNNSFLEKEEDYKWWKLDKIEFYILNKLLYSLIVSCDFYATYEYFGGEEAEFGMIGDIYKLEEAYVSGEKYGYILDYLNNKNNFQKGRINELRSELFLEAEENLLKNTDKSIFFLEAPTGSGKTNTSLNLALKLAKENRAINKIFYIFPFNTLVEQTKNIFEEIFSDEEFAVINSITPIITKEEANPDGDESINYEKSLLDKQFLHYPIILTTHVNFFNYLFGTGREANFPIPQLCNSVVIIDEIQSYRNKIWREIIVFLKKYAELLNIKIIIMSATLPRLDRLLFEDSGFTMLIKDRAKYFKDKVFKDRVRIDFSMLYKEKLSLEDIVSKVDELVKERGKSKILIEFIKKSTAREFYNIIKDKYPKVIELTGDDNKYTRDKAIKEIDESEDIIVVATQVIEAGVDIDMDIGLKDISFLDNEEQFLGRINRSCKKSDKDCTAFFFNYDKAADIYREDLRIGLDLTSEKGRQMLIDKDFQEFYEVCFDRIKEKNASLNKDNLDGFLANCQRLSYGDVAERMRLINQKSFQIYLAYDMEVEDIKIDGLELWKEYKMLCLNKSLSYAKKAVDLSKLREKMSYFTYNLVAYQDIEKPFFFNEEFGGYYFIENGMHYIVEEKEGVYKFDRKKFEKNTGGLFL